MLQHLYFLLCLFILFPFLSGASEIVRITLLQNSHLGRLWWQLMAFFFIESDVLEIQARGNSEHFFCESLRISVRLPPPTPAAELASVFYLTGTINESEFFGGRHLGVISILPLNCSRYLPSGHLVN